MQTFTDSQPSDQAIDAPGAHVGAGRRATSTRHRVKKIVLSTGVTLPYVEQGDATGVPVVMLHGVTDSWHSFEPVLPYLPQSIRAFALTQRGHGDADRPVSGYRTQHFAADVAAFVAALGLRKVVIVGHSMGSTNALRFVIDYPEYTRGLVIAGAFATYRNNPVIVEYWESAVRGLTDPVAPQFAREFQESTLAQPIPAGFLDLAVQESLKVPAHVWLEAFAGMLEDDFVADLGKIKAPTLGIWGAQDAFARRIDQDQLVAGIRGSRLVVYQNAGHAVHWEEPERFAKDLSEFVGGLSA